MPSKFGHVFDLVQEVATDDGIFNLDAATLNAMLPLSTNLLMLGEFPEDEVNTPEDTYILTAALCSH
jgi:hypothetical protein